MLYITRAKSKYSKGKHTNSYPVVGLNSSSDKESNMFIEKIKKDMILYKDNIYEDYLWMYEDYFKIPSASDSDLSRIENEFGIVLDNNFKKLYKYKNGSGRDFKVIFLEQGCGDFEGYCLYNAEEIIKYRNKYDELYSPEDDAFIKCDKRIKPYFLNKKWIGIGCATGSHFLYLDYDPTEYGTMGQIILKVHDPDRLYYIAKDIEELFLMQDIKNYRLGY